MQRCECYSPRHARRSLCQRLCVILSGGGVGVPSGASSEPLAEEPRCSVSLCAASISGMRSRAAASSLRCSLSRVFASSSWCSRDSIRASYCSTRRWPGVSPMSPRVSMSSTRTYTRPSGAFSWCSEPRSMRLRTAPSVVPSSRAASGTVTRCLLSAMTGSIDAYGHAGQTVSTRNITNDG